MKPTEAFSSAAASKASTSKAIEPAKSFPAEIVDINLKVNNCEFEVSLYREKVRHKYSSN